MNKFEILEKVRQYPWDDHSEWIAENTRRWLREQGRPDNFDDHPNMDASAQIQHIESLVTGTAEEVEEELAEVAPGQCIGSPETWRVPWVEYYLDLLSCEDYEHKREIASDLSTGFPNLNLISGEASYQGRLNEMRDSFWPIYRQILARREEIDVAFRKSDDPGMHESLAEVIAGLRFHIELVISMLSRWYSEMQDEASKKVIIRSLLRTSDLWIEPEGLQGPADETAKIVAAAQALAASETDSELSRWINNEIAEALRIRREYP